MCQILVACQTMQAEIEYLLQSSECIFDCIHWIQSGMHNVAERLREEIQSRLSEIEEAETVVLGFGACGNALAGITAGDYELIIPKADDCISIMLGSCKRKEQLKEHGETYYLTGGWLGGESNIYKEYLFSVEKYGKEMADIIYVEILKQYKNLGVIDTKAYDYKKLLADTKVIAEDLRLCQFPIDGDLAYLKRLLDGSWNESEFLRVLPHQTVTMEMFLQR